MVKWGILGIISLFVVIYIPIVFGYRSDCVRAEAGIKAQYEQNQNNYDNMWKKFKEMSQVPDMYVADMKKLWDGAIQGRYGEGGSKALVQFITEHNPQLDSAVYTKLQTAVEAGRNSFAAEQQQLIDKKRQYEIVLMGNRALFVGFFFSFPTIDFDDYAIVTSDETQDAFKTRKSGRIELRDE